MDAHRGAVAVLAHQLVTCAGTTVTPVAAAEAGDSTIPAPNTWLRVTNGSGGDIVVTIAGTGDDYEVAIAAGESRLIGPLDAATVDTSTGVATWTYSDHTDVTVAAVRLDPRGAAATATGNPTPLPFTDDFTGTDDWQDLSTLLPSDNDPIGVASGEASITSLSGTADQVGAGAVTGWRGIKHRQTGLATGFSIVTPSAGMLNTLVAGPASHVTPHATAGAIVGGYSRPISSWELAYHGREQDKFQYLDLVPGPALDHTATGDVELKAIGTKIALYYDGAIVAGPVTIPAELAQSTRHGFTVDAITTDAIGTSALTGFEMAAEAGPLATRAVPAVAATGTVLKGTGSTATVSYPSGVATGNLLWLTVATIGATITTPSGWTLANSTTSGTLRTSVFRKIAVLADESAGSVAVTLSGSVAHAGSCTRLTGHNTHSVGSATGTGTASSTTATAPAQTLLGQYRRSLVAYAAAADVTITLPSGVTSIANTSAGGAAITLRIGRATWDSTYLPPYGGFVDGAYVGQATGTLAATLSSAANNTATHSLINPA